MHCRRGFKFRASNPVCAAIRREIRTRRMEDAIAELQNQLHLFDSDMLLRVWCRLPSPCSLIAT